MYTCAAAGEFVVRCTGHKDRIELKPLGLMHGQDEYSILACHLPVGVRTQCHHSHHGT